jgi:hypothetical protein
MMSIARKYILILAAALVAGCGGGSPEPEAFSPQVLAATVAQAAATSITSAAAAELLLAKGETDFHSLFPVHTTTLTSGPFAYRYYPTTGMYLGVVITPNPTYTLNGVYVVGPGFGSLSNPTYVGLLTQYVSVTIDPGITYKTLHITVTAYGQSASADVPNVPLPATQVDFCSALTTDANLSAALAAYGGSYTITGCSFGGTSGTFSLNVTAPGYPAIPITVTYSYS